METIATQEFVARALKSLQEQINRLENQAIELKARIYSLEESRWNLGKGNIEACPRDDLVVRLADGRLCFNGRQEEITYDTD